VRPSAIFLISVVDNSGRRSLIGLSHPEIYDFSRTTIQPSGLGHLPSSARRSRLPVNITTVTDSDATLAGQPSGKMLKIYIIAANDAGQAAPSDTVTIVVP
jgi:hypothetical protein